EAVARLLAAPDAGGREGLDVDPDLVEPRVRHLRRDGALPDQGVQPELVALEHCGDPLRGSEHARRTNGLVGLLRVARAGLVPASLGQRVRLAVILLDEL